MRAKLTKEQIKEIADRAEGKEPEYELRTFVCKRCKHEIVVNPKYPKYEMPTMCTPCWEEIEQGRRKAAEIDLAAKSLDLFAKLMTGDLDGATTKKDETTTDHSSGEKDSQPQ